MEGQNGGSNEPPIILGKEFEKKTVRHTQEYAKPPSSNKEGNNTLNEALSRFNNLDRKLTFGIPDEPYWMESLKFNQDVLPKGQNIDLYLQNYRTGKLQCELILKRVGDYLKKPNLSISNQVLEVILESLDSVELIISFMEAQYAPFLEDDKEIGLLKNNLVVRQKLGFFVPNGFLDKTTGTIAQDLSNIQSRIASLNSSLEGAGMEKLLNLIGLSNNDISLLQQNAELSEKNIALEALLMEVRAGYQEKGSQIRGKDEKIASFNMAFGALQSLMRRYASAGAQAIPLQELADILSPQGGFQGQQSGKRVRVEGNHFQRKALASGQRGSDSGRHRVINSLSLSEVAGVGSPENLNRVEVDFVRALRDEGGGESLSFIASLLTRDSIDPSTLRRFSWEADNVFGFGLNIEGRDLSFCFQLNGDGASIGVVYVAEMGGNRNLFLEMYGSNGLNYSSFSELTFEITKIADYLRSV